MRLFFSDSFLNLLFKLPKDVQKDFLTFKSKFRECSTSAGLHLEVVQGAKDSSLRSARIGRDYRAILSADKNDVFTILYIDHHDDAYHWAENKKCVWNDVSQSYQIISTQNVIEESSVQVSKPAVVETNNVDYLPKAPTPDNISDEQLQQIGVPVELIQTVRTIRTWTDLERAEKTLPDDAYEHLIDFCDGGNLELIIVGVREGCVEEGGDKLLSDNNRRHFIEITDADLESIFDQGFEQWQLFLHPSQRKIVKSNYKGTVKVSGSAGTGKTVAALHRLKFLCEKADSQVLFTTFTTTLCDNLKSLVAKMGVPEGRFTLTNIDKLLNGLAAKYNLGKTDYHNTLPEWKDVVESEVTEFEPAFLKAEYEDVILYNDNQTFEEYVRQPRIGRSRSLTRKQRVEVWKLVEKYKAIKNSKGFADRYELFNVVTKYLVDNGIHPFTNVIADEIQDFSNPELRFLRALVQEGPNDLFFAGDPYQKVYSGKKLNFGAAGINIRGSKSKKLKVNYRTTEEIKRRAVSIIKGVPFEDFDGGEENTIGYVSLVHGKQPVYEMADSSELEGKKVIDWLEELTNSEYSLSDICIAAPNNNALRSIKDLLHRRSLPVIDYTGSGNKCEGGVSLCTFHSIKGLEFKAVILMGVNENNVPSKVTTNYPFNTMDPVQQKDYLLQMRSLLYVAITRAREQAFITGSGEKSGLLK